MASGILKIHGFISDEQKFKPEWNKGELEETVRVETIAVPGSRHDDVGDMVEYLPSYLSGPGSTAFNPLQATFTFYWSTHPKYTNYTLLECLSIDRVAGSGVFWDIRLKYGNYIINEIVAKDRDTGQPIVNPVEQPVIWSSSTSLVQKETMTKQNGTFLRHEHGLALTDPITVEEAHTTHTWNFNVYYNALNYHSHITYYCGKVSDTSVFGTDGQHWKCTQASATEAYESFGSGNTKTTYHYVKITISYEYNPSGWIDDAKLISRSTQQLVAGKYVPIFINDNGDRAQEPWPLVERLDDDNCFGADYDAPNLDIENWAVLDTGYPVTADLYALANYYNLRIP